MTWREYKFLKNMKKRINGIIETFLVGKILNKWINKSKWRMMKGQVGLNGHSANTDE